MVDIGRGRRNWPRVGIKKGVKAGNVSWLRSWWWKSPNGALYSGISREDEYCFMQFGYRAVGGIG